MLRSGLCVQSNWSYKLSIILYIVFLDTSIIVYIYHFIKFDQNSDIIYMFNDINITVAEPHIVPDI